MKPATECFKLPPLPSWPLRRLDKGTGTNLSLVSSTHQDGSYLRPGDYVFVNARITRHTHTHKPLTLKPATLIYCCPDFFYHYFHAVLMCLPTPIYCCYDYYYFFYPMLICILDRESKLHFMWRNNSFFSYM